MRVPTGSTDRYMYFVAVDATDLKTRETTLTGFSVFYSLNGAAETAYTTPTTTEIDATNCPGVYALLLDEGNTLNSAHDEAEMMIHITHASMAPVTRTYELFRPKMTEGQTATVANGAVDADIERLQGSAIATPTVAGVLEVDVTHWLGTAAATPTTAGVPEVDVTFWLGGAVATPTTTGVPEVDITHIAGAAVNTSSAQLGVNVVNAAGTAWGSGAITAGVIAADAIGASELAADAIAEIADAVWDEDATAHQTQGTFGQAIGDPGADTNTIFKATVTDATGVTVGTDTATLLTRMGTPSDLGGGATLAGNLSDIEAQTDDIGVAGAGLSAIPWNAAWDAEVQSEVDDALVAQNLDHLVKIAVDTNFSTTVHADSVIGQIADNGAGFDRTTDSLEAIRDRGDAAWITATGFSTHSAADVWSVATRSLTVLDEDSTTLDLDATIRAAVGLTAANLDTQLDALPTAAENATAVLTTQMTESYAANGTAPTLAQAMFAQHQALMQHAISGTTWSVYKLDNVTVAFAITLDDATTPTSARRV